MIGYYCGMPTSGPSAINKSALNALVDLYYLYGDMVFDANHSDESPQQLDVFFLQGGLKAMITKYFQESHLDPVAAGDTEGPLTLERLLTRPTISAIVGDESVKVSHLRGVLKGYFDGQEAYGASIPDDAAEVIRQGRLILAERTRRKRSSANAALVDLATALIAYEDQIFKIGNVEMPIRRNTMEDYVLKYMYQQRSKGDVINRDDIANWVGDASGDDTVSSKSIYDKCNSINKKVQDQIGTTLKVFDTSADNQIKRNY
jgi:hypothetical protein